MRSLEKFRQGKPGFYPDQSVYAAFACAEFGLAFENIDGGNGFLFGVSSKTRTIHFGAGRCSWYPQNSATASTLASDKYFTNKILERSGAPSLGGEYFFLHDRHRAYRPVGHEREDALGYFRSLGGTAFVKPLLGSRGDFAQAIDSEISLVRYLREVSQYYDAILIQPAVAGTEYRVFVLDEEVLYTARKYPPFIVADGVLSVRKLVAAHNKDLRSRGMSQVSVAEELALDIERFDREMGDHVYADRVHDDFLGGVRSGVNGTPTFYINGVRYDGSYEHDDLVAALEQAARERR
jgi:hypothetical protein